MSSSFRLPRKPTDSPSREALLKDLEERYEKMKAIAYEQEKNAIVYLPSWHEGKRGSPNSFLRSALFAAIQSKDRVFIKDTILYSQQGITVRFTGEQLNQEDMTVWLALADLARKQPLGQECSFTGYSILKHMGQSVGGREHERLRLCIERMTACMVKIEMERHTYGGSLIDDFIIDEETKHYKLNLNKKLNNLFGDNDWTAINWEQRKQLRNKPLSLKLHEYYSSYEFPKAITIEFMHSITGSKNNQLRGFKRQVKIALEELVKIGFLESYEIANEKVTVKRIRKITITKQY